MNYSIRAAVASAIALASGQAFALNGTNITGTEVKLYFGGATATDNSFANLPKLTTANGGICVDGSLDFYTWVDAAAATQGRLAFCTGNANSGVSGSKIAIFKESQGGSANGVGPVASQTNLNFIPFTQAALSACQAASTQTNVATGTFAQFVSHGCSVSNTTLQALPPNAGVSDIDPATFVGTGGISAPEAAALTATSTVAVTFNPIVSIPFYRALQTAQGLTTDDAGANIPTLTLSQARGMFSGQVTDASRLWSANPTTASQVPVSATSKTIFVCRRSNTSGTMASFKILFLGELCSKNPTSVASFVVPDQRYSTSTTDEEGVPLGAGLLDQEGTGVSWTQTSTVYDSGGTNLGAIGFTTARVFGGFSSGDVRNCVNYHSSVGNFAVGTASTESKPSGTTQFRYVKVDGAEPSLKATMEGRYSYFTENTFNRKTSGTGSLSGSPLTLYNNILTRIGSAGSLAAINSSWTDSLSLSAAGTGQWDTGILDLPTSTNKPTPPINGAEVRSTPVNGQTRNYTGTPNNCNMSGQSSFVVP